MVDNPQLNTPGEILGAARLKAGLSIDELSVLTKIPADMLQAIERDEYHKISGDLYVKSFMASFAREVGVEPELVVDMYRDFSGESPDAGTGDVTTQWNEESVEVSSLGLSWVKIIASVVGVIFLGVLLYFFVLRDKGKVEGNTLETPPVQTMSVKPIPDRTPISIDKPDTLSVGWQISPAVADEAVAEDESSTPAKPPAFIAAKDSASRILATTGRGHLPSAFPGDEQVEFEGKRSWPVVLRLICNQPIDIKIKRDAEHEFSPVVWPASGTQADPLPAKDLVSGNAYAVRRGFAVFWGAGDHFSLILPAGDDAEISVNGIVRDLSRIKPGQEIILDAPHKGAGRQ